MFAIILAKDEIRMQVEDNRFSRTSQMVSEKEWLNHGLEEQICLEEDEILASNATTITSAICSAGIKISPKERH